MLSCLGHVCVSLQESCVTDLHHHRQLDADIEVVRTLYPDSAVFVRSETSLLSPYAGFKGKALPPTSPSLSSAREYGSIDAVDVDLHIDANFLDVSEIYIALILMWGRPGRKL